MGKLEFNPSYYKVEYDSWTLRYLFFSAAEG